MTSRRSFLLGIGALVSASFVTRVKAHVLESARPLLLEPNRAEETLYLYDQSGWDGDWKWRVSLGPDDLRSTKAPGSAASTGSRDAVQESREEFVRRHWQRPGVVANGVTLVDLYDRIRALEERVARAEQQSASPPPPD